MATLPDTFADTALARLFAAERRDGAATWFSLPGGGHLFTAGAAADAPPDLVAGEDGDLPTELALKLRELGAW